MAEGQDTEITLGTGRLLGLFFGLVVVCGIFFGLGFSLGRNSVKSGLVLQETPSASSPAANGGGAKSMAGTPERVVPAAAEQTSAADNSQAAQAPPPVVTSPGATATSTTPAPELSKPVAPSSGSGYTVQVAAVSKQEDADALVDALKKKAYPVFVASASSDKLFHVQVGPFGEIKDAEAMKAKLMGDGYNPIVKR
jgi:DedD protein